MKKLLGILVLGLLLSNSAYAMTYEEYWEGQTERLIDSRRICAEEAHKSGSFNSEIFKL